jgi:hypothetical protein
MYFVTAVLFFVLALFPLVSAQAALVIMDDINGDDDIKVSGRYFPNVLKERTHEWIVDTDFDLEAIGIYLNSNFNTAGSELTLLLRSDDNGSPAGVISSVIFTVNSSQAGWYGGYLDDSVSVSSGETYWIGIYSDKDRLNNSIGWIGSYFTDDENAEIAGEYVNNGTIDDPEWDGPYRDMKPMLRFYGSPSAVPIPAAFWLLGSGLFGLFGLRRRRRS